jgi:exodeoxyribonuclease-3
VSGQKSYNGVALLSRVPATDIVTTLPGDAADSHARYIEASFGSLRVASVYLPNGNPAPGPKFDYKLAWMKRLEAHAKGLLNREIAFALAGDFNVCPTDADVYNAQAMREDALCLPESRNLFRALLNLGLTDAFRALHPDERRYTYWDYMQRRFETDHGLRIDHILLSPQATDRLVAVEIDKAPRAQETPSDHTPVWCELDL